MSQHVSTEIKSHLFSALCCWLIVEHALNVGLHTSQYIPQQLYVLKDQKIAHPLSFHKVTVMLSEVTDRNCE